MSPSLPKPCGCLGCDLHDRGAGFVPPEGPVAAPLLFIGEAPGGTEAALGRPFVGDAGGMLQRLLNLQGWSRDHIRLANTVSCRPVNDWMDGSPQAPWFHSAIRHCSVHRDPVLAEGHPVVVTLGSTALKTVMGLHGQRKILINSFHGSVLRDPTDRFWVVPTFHPSFLQRGAHNLIGTVLWDLQQAEKAITQGKPGSDHSLVLDPPLEWFKAWVSNVITARVQDPAAYPLSVDIETPDKASGKDEGEITAEDRSFTILRVNVACHPDEGVTVPYLGGYIEELKRLLTSPGPIWTWNGIGYDWDRMVASGLLQAKQFPQIVDLMWYWHRLQSDLPRGLGFVAPFYSAYGPWKHLADSEPALYGAIDGLQTHRIGFGILRDLHQTGMFPSVDRYVQKLMVDALYPAQVVGVQVDRPELIRFGHYLHDKATEFLETIQGCVPESLRPLTPKAGLTRAPKDNVLHAKATAFTRKGVIKSGKPSTQLKLDLYKKSRVVEREVSKDIQVCLTCGALEIHRKHRCADKKLVPELELQTRTVTRWYWEEPFNPDAPLQVLAYIKFRKHPVGKAKKTQQDTTNKETLKKLVRTGDPFYSALLDYRAVQKIKGTYVEGTERRLDALDRIHPEPTFKPSTARLSYQNPNITNVVGDKGGKLTIAAGFRKCIVATSTARLIEVDFSGSEAVDFGWWIRDPQYIRLAKLGVHSGLAAHILGRPFDLGWSDASLGEFFKEIKESDDQHVIDTYSRSKRFVHSFSYGLTIHGMTLQFPEIFPTVKIAEHYADLFMTLAPKAIPFHKQVRELAFKQHYLGGPGVHPFGFKHWFWSVFTYKKITSAQYWKIIAIARKRGWADGDAPVASFNGQYFRVNLGEDGKRAVAFLPQSTTAGKLQECMLRLFSPESPSYIGEVAREINPAGLYGTPLRAPIHDSLLLEIPARKFDLVASLVFQEMQRPFKELPLPAEWNMGEYLATGVSAKVGKAGGSWADMEKLTVPGYSEVGVATDRFVDAPMEDEQDDADDFSREIA